ncbi:MAG: hypothetical protein KC442_09350 [Thermomicrobiales bacterium]|nr:hypothetical protein [Thermomicrobiales bacterium]
MDGRQFDILLRDLSNSRRSLAGAALAAAGVLLGLVPTIAKKKKKKKCAKKCKDGCCTGKFGKCVKPAQQDATRCGNGGEICRTNCGDGVDGDTCDSDCAGCCQGNACLISTDEHCGYQGRACVACGAKEECGIAGTCCGLQGHACTTIDDCCMNRLCDPDRKVCCSVYGVACSTDLDCCDPDSMVCENGECLIRSGSPCELLQMCEGLYSCPSSLTCCAANGRHCEFDGDCCEDEDTCDDGICKRHVGDFCDETIICRDRYPHCVHGACRRCLDGQISTGSDEICCPSDRYCPNANEGRGACCENVGCCLPDEDGVACGLREHVGEGECGSGEYPPEH